LFENTKKHSKRCRDMRSRAAEGGDGRMSARKDTSSFHATVVTDAVFLMAQFCPLWTRTRVLLHNFATRRVPNLRELPHKKRERAVFYALSCDGTVTR